MREREQIAVLPEVDLGPVGSQWEDHPLCQRLVKTYDLGMFLGVGQQIAASGFEYLQRAYSLGPETEPGQLMLKRAWSLSDIAAGLQTLETIKKQGGAALTTTASVTENTLAAVTAFGNSIGVGTDLAAVGFRHLDSSLGTTDPRVAEKFLQAAVESTRLAAGLQMAVEAGEDQRWVYRHEEKLVNELERVTPFEVRMNLDNFSKAIAARLDRWLENFDRLKPEQKTRIRQLALAGTVGALTAFFAAPLFLKRVSSALAAGIGDSSKDTRDKVLGRGLSQLLQEPFPVCQMPGKFVVVVDSSGSTEGEKNQAITGNLPSFVNAFTHTGSLFGMSVFSETARLDPTKPPLTRINERELVQDAIGQIVAGGNTAIGKGIKAATWAMTTTASLVGPAHYERMIVISDFRQTDADDDPRRAVYDAAPEFGESLEIATVAIGPLTGEARLLAQDIATGPTGKQLFFEAQTPGDLRVALAQAVEAICPKKWDVVWASGSEIWGMGANGLGQTRLVSQEGGVFWHPRFPGPHPGQNEFVFQGIPKDESQSQLFIMKRNGEIVRVHGMGSDFWHDHANVSPEGTRLVYSLGRSNTDRHRLYLMELINGNEQQITGDSVNARYPDWSPLGNVIVGSDLDSGQIFIINADGSGFRFLAEGWKAVFAPCGCHLAFIRRVEGRETLWTMHITGHDQQPIPIEGSIAGLSWSPDGKSLAVVSHDGEMAKVWKVEFAAEYEGQNLRKTTERMALLAEVPLSAASQAGILSGSLAERANWDPAWSADGRTIFFAGNDGDFEIYKVPCDGGRLTRLTYKPGYDGQPHARKEPIMNNWLTLTNIDSPSGGARRGDRLVELLRFSNQGTITATDVLLHNQLPDGTVFVAASPGCQNQIGEITCQIGNLAPGEVKDVTITGTVGLNASELITNTAQIEGDDTGITQAEAAIKIEVPPTPTPEPSPTPPPPPKPVYLPLVLKYFPPPMLTKEADHGQVDPGEYLVYILKVNETDGGEIEDRLPQNVTYGGVSVTNGFCSFRPEIEVISCYLTEAGEVRIGVNVKFNAQGSVTNVATLQSGPESYTATLTIPVR